MSEVAFLPPAELEPFTYVKDAAEFIYYIKGAVSYEGAAGYSAVCVYYPDESGDRAQTHGDTVYSKFPSQGLDYERQAVLKHMPNGAAEYVLGHSCTGDIFNRQFLFLPANDITEVYSPQSSLHALLSRNNEDSNNVAVEATYRAVQAFASVDVPLNKLGLYGSLQCGVVKMKADAKLKDVDMLVEGVGYYDNVRALALASPAPDVPLPLTVASDPKRSLAVRRRRQIAQFGIPSMRGVHCDVRLLRERSDPNDYHETASLDPQIVAICDARVIDSQQSLCLPFAYQVVTPEHRRPMWVVGKHYRSLGVAAVGDVVEAQGLRIANDTILVSHPSDDWIQLQATRSGKIIR